MTHTVVTDITPRTVSHHTHLNITRGNRTDVIAVHTNGPLGRFHVGDEVTIDEPKGGFSKARHDVGIVRKIAHVITLGRDDLARVTLVDIDVTEG